MAIKGIIVPSKMTLILNHKDLYENCYHALSAFLLHILFRKKMGGNGQNPSGLANILVASLAELWEGLFPWREQETFCFHHNRKGIREGLRRKREIKKREQTYSVDCGKQLPWQWDRG